MAAIIGRKAEMDALAKYNNSDKSEFIAIYGRRRVGKTFLVSQFYKSFAFETSGIIGGTKKDEMEAFFTSLCLYGYKGKKPRTWMEMFTALRQLLEERKKRGVKVIFIDELPCFDTRCSGFIKALDFFWNTWASKQSNIKLIVCGSATSWMVRNIINNKGGLHNRITHEMHLHAFNLNETKQFLWKKGLKWDNMLVAQIYMIMGGVPYYLDLLDADKGFSENIDSLFFAKDATMKLEFGRLYSSLFANPKQYKDIVILLAKHKKGLTRGEIAEKLKTSNNGHLTTVLEDLEYCDFIRSYVVMGKNSSTKNNGRIYQLIDQYTHFYHYFDTLRTRDEHYWTFTLATPTQNTWYGLAFERLLMQHIPQALTAMHLDRMHTECYSWRCDDKKQGTQIDLVIDRADGITDICEAKFSQQEFSLDKTEHDKILKRKEVFNIAVRNKSTRLVLFTTIGLKKNTYSDIFQATISLNDLFKF
ncbi:MAG: ATP-binding protein [Bacteroidales bacterium]|nr:ATP-binding protein [Bacteroidales bacterium]